MLPVFNKKGSRSRAMQTQSSASAIVGGGPSGRVQNAKSPLARALGTTLQPIESMNIYAIKW